MRPESFWQEILPPDAVAIAIGGYPARFDDGSILLLPIRHLPDGPTFEHSIPWGGELRAGRRLKQEQQLGAGGAPCGRVTRGSPPIGLPDAGESPAGSRWPLGLRVPFEEASVSEGSSTSGRASGPRDRSDIGGGRSQAR